MTRAVTIAAGRTIRFLAAVALGCGMTASGAPAAAGPDWPLWRGPNRDGISAETQWNPAALAGTPVFVWKINVGNGHSAVAIKGERLYTLGNKSGKDYVYCLEVQTGKEIWHYAYDCVAGDYPGPRCTPVVDGERVYSMSRAGQVLCLNAKDGALIWQKNVVTELKATPPQWGFAGSACVYGKTVLFNAGEHGVMFNKENGAVVWASASGIGGYATPVIYTNGARLTGLIFASKALAGVDLRTGKEAWSFAWEVGYDVNAADPIVAGDTVFISSGYNKGGALLELTAGAPKVCWENKNMCNHFSTGVLIGGHLYGVSGNTGGALLSCVNFTTGAAMWTQKGGFESISAAGGKLLAMNVQGQLVIAEASPTAYKELARANVLPVGGEIKCWTMPVLCRGLVFCRNSVGDLVCVDLRK